jgi:hypothetical protein
VPLIPLREVAGWEHDLHAAMNNIQDEIDLVGKAQPALTPMPPPIPLSALPSYRNIFSARLNCSRPASRPCGSVFAIFTARMLARRRENGLQDEDDRRTVH